MTGRCPQDGGFIGSCGCTHPNHQHSELVKGLLAVETPHMISVRDAEAALREGFYVQSESGNKVGFGEKLLKHIDDDNVHSSKDAEERKTRLLYAISAVRNPDKVEVGHRMIPGRTAYAKAFQEFGILAVTDAESGTIAKVFTFFPRRGARIR